MSSQHSSSATEHFNKLIQFRQAAYEQLGNACDALFELTDAVIQMRQIQSFAELSCAPAFRRKWPSAYEAMQDGRPKREGLLRLYLEQLPAPERLIIVGDHTAWPRLSADTLADRSYQYQSTPIPGRMPVTIGHGYSTNAVIPQDWDKGVSGTFQDGRLVEIVELPDHPWFVASQFHPEFKSRPTRPAPLFPEFVGAALERARSRAGVQAASR